MEYHISILIFAFGIIAWIPFLNGVYGQDQASAMYVADHIKRGKFTLYKDIYAHPIGQLAHIIFLQFFFKKENTKAFYWAMCLYCSFSSFVLFWVIFNLSGLMAAIIGSIAFSLYIGSPRLDGNWGAVEQLLSLPLISSLFCILISSHPGSYSLSCTLILLSGILFGYAVLVKQIALVYLPGFILMLINTTHPVTFNLLFLTGVLFVNLVPLFYFWLRHNAFWEYLTCMWLHSLPFAINPRKYNKYYPRFQVQGTKDKSIRKKVIYANFRSLYPILFLSFIGIVSLSIYHFSFLYLGLFVCLLASIWTIFMRKTLFPHYWLNMVPWLAIFAGCGLKTIFFNLSGNGILAGVSVAGIFAVVLLFIDAIRVDRKYYVLSKDPYGFLRKVWGDALVNNYKLWKQFGKYIKKTTKPEDKILVCGYVPQILMYSDRTHFTPEFCQYTEDYLNTYNQKNPSYFGFLSSIYKFKFLKQKENIFHKSHPKVIVFAQGNVDVEGFEKLTGIKYVIDENLNGFQIYSADLELTELMSIFENTNNESIQKTKNIDSNKSEYSDSLDLQDWESALKISKQLLAKDPHKSEHLLTLGECLIGSGNYKLLFRFYNRLIEKKLVSTASRLDLLAKLGEAYCHQDKFKEAEEIFKNILKLKPDNPIVLNNLGFVYSRQDNIEKASLCFQKALELDPDNEDAIANLKQIKTLC
ncbi:MAG: tetratricopeptide repeat protein [Maribacter sp.]|nr:tetratricopeptide repeat protein [Maribacter sp.]